MAISVRLYLTPRRVGLTREEEIMRGWRFVLVLVAVMASLGLVFTGVAQAHGHVDHVAGGCCSET
jgi:hypothetical protein